MKKISFAHKIIISALIIITLITTIAVILMYYNRKYIDEILLVDVLVTYNILLGFLLYIHKNRMKIN